MTMDDSSPVTLGETEPLPGEVVESFVEMCRLCNVEGGGHHRECPLVDDRDWTATPLVCPVDGEPLREASMGHGPVFKSRYVHLDGRAHDEQGFAAVVVLGDGTAAVREIDDVHHRSDGTTEYTLRDPA